MAAKATELRIDWPFLKGTLILAGVALSLLFGLLGYFYWQAQGLDEEIEQSRQQLETARAALEREMESSRLADRYREDFGKLLEQRFLQGPDRLAVTELLRKLEEELDLPMFGFRFDPRQAMESYQGLTSGGYRLLGSLQHLQFSLHDERELKTVLQRLKDAGQGTFVVERCSLHRPERRLHLNDGKGNVQGACRLRWLALEQNGEVADAF